MLTGFAVISDGGDTTARTLTMFVSPFIEGVVFTLTGHAHVRPIIDGVEKKDGLPSPVFKTSLGEDKFLFLSMVTKAVVDADNKIHNPSGSFNKLVETVIAENKDKTDNEILATIEAKMTNKKIKVTRVPYIKLTTQGKRIPSSYINLDVVE